MKIFEANISYQVLVFLNEFLKNTTSFEIANQKMFDAFGIKHFFDNDDFNTLIKYLFLSNSNVVEEPDRAEYGDFQTNKDLANKVAKHLSKRNISPEIVIEPTCGKGNFIIASLSNFKTLKKIFGI
ncbi:MAG: hypothetical protein Q7U47_06625 [Paludibacter sp.]|nr:hypothetical protein [Paludibacter sp.]